MKRFILLISMCFFNIILLQAQPGTNDYSFNVTDKYPHLNSRVKIVVEQPNGKVLVGGSFGRAIVRYNEDGSLDTPFFNAVGTGFNIDSEVNTIAIQPDGKILVGGYFTSYNSNIISNIIRLNTDGTIDNTFNIGTGFNSTVVTIILQSDGKILVGGSFTSYNGTNANRIARLNSNGTIDSTFNIGIGFNNVVSALTLQPDGKILAGGTFTSYKDIGRKSLIRLNTDGSIDNTLNIGSGFNSSIYTITLQLDGKLLVGGTFTNYRGSLRNHFVRLNSDGTIDNTLSIGTGFDSYIFASTIQNNGKILVGGWFNNYNGITCHGIICLNSNGSIDNSFNIGTAFNYSGSSVYSLNMQSNGKVLVGGNFTNYNGNDCNRVIRLNPNGSVDNLFKIGTGFNNNVSAVTLQPDGKILVGGTFTNYNNSVANYIIRLNADGSKDNTFNTGTGFGTLDFNAVFAIVVQPDGKILVGGNFANYNGNTKYYLIRLNSDGSIDNTFNTGTGFSTLSYYFVSTICLQPDGKILVGGSLGNYNGNVVRDLLRLNSDGTFDNTFNTGTGFNASISKIILQPDGKILIGGGNFSNSNGNITRGIIRLNSDGSIDNTFNTGTGFNGDIVAIHVYSDGKILVGGTFTNYNGTSINRILRLNSNGTIDNTFSIGTGFSYYLKNFILQPDGKIIAIGQFTQYNGNNYNRIIRLNSDGSVDNTFNIGTGLDYDDSTSFNEGISFNAMCLQPDGKVLIGGWFILYNDIIRNHLVRINTSCSSIISPNIKLNGLVGTMYHQQFTQTGFSGNVTWQIISGNLPNGLSLNSSTGVISGIPTTSQNVIFTLQVSNGICSFTQEYEFDVKPCIVEILPDSLEVGMVGNNYSQTLSQTGITGNIAWQITNGNLPEGLSLNSSTGVISGIPTKSDSTSFEVEISDGICMTKKKYHIEIVNTIDILAGCDITVYPNPTSQNLKITFNNTYQENYQIKLFDILGRDIFIRNFEVKQEKELAIFNIQDLSKGVYILEIKGNSCKKLLKVVKVDN